MKRPIVILALLAFMAAGLHAQGIGLGIKAGANFANQAVKDVDTKSITNFHGGAYLNINFNDHFGITPEVLFSSTGSKWEDLQVDYNYVSIPVMIRFKPIKLIKVEAGPQFSFLTKAELEDFGDISDQLKKNDFGLAFGAGLNLPFGLNAGARYVLGLSNVSDVSDGDVASEEIKNRTFQIYVGWTLLGAK